MKQTLLLTVIFLQSLCLAMRGQEAATGIQFEHGTWEEALAKAQSEHKLLFVDVWATWCGPCKKLASEVFPQKEVGDFFNKHFVCFKLQADIPDKSIRDKYQSLAQTYNVGGLPTLLWINEKGKAEHFAIGYMGAEALLEEARKALNPSLRTSNVTDNWDSQPHTLVNGLIYFEANSKETDKFDDFFLKLTPEEQLDERLNALLYFKITLPPDSKALHYMAAKKDSLSAIYPKAKEWNGMLESQLHRLFGASPIEGMDALAAKFSSYNLPFLPQLEDRIKCLMLFRFEKIDEAFALAQQMTKKYGTGDFLRDFVDVTFFIATKQHTSFTTTQKQSILTWAKEYAAKMEGNNSYTKDLVLFEAYALNGMKTEMKQHIDKLKQRVIAQSKNKEGEDRQLQFYDELAASAEAIQ